MFVPEFKAELRARLALALALASAHYSVRGFLMM